MCLAYPGIVKDIKGLQATIKYPSSLVRVLIGDKKVKVGDPVLVQGGVIVKKISKRESGDIAKAWSEI
jgi:hydrogenase maturation factor